MIPQHSLPSGRYPLPGPDFHRLELRLAHTNSFSARHAQRFLSAHDQINNLFLLPRHQMSATRAERARAFQAWHDVCGIKQAA